MRCRGPTFRRWLTALLTVVVLVAASGCSTVHRPAIQIGAGSPDRFMDGIVPPCNQSDSTIQCCLKQNPGQYERCGALPPDPKPSPKRRPLPPFNPPVDAPDDRLPKDDQDRCTEHYVKCIDEGGGSKPGNHSGQTLCGACMDYCTTHGFWPLAVYGREGKIPCLGQ